MARVAAPRAASAKPVETKDAKVNGTAARPSRAKKPESAPAAAPATNGTAKEPAKRIARGRAKEPEPILSEPEPESESEPEPAPKKTTTKRKKDESSEPEADTAPAKKAKVDKPKAALKKPKAAKVVKEPSKPLPKGPRRMKGKKNEINAIQFTEPLKVFVFGEGSSGELGFGATKKAIDVKRPRFNEALSNHNVVRIATGGMHVVALTKDNKILTWGVNDNGALGRDTSHVEAKMRDLDADESDSDSEDETGGLNDAEATPTAVSSEYFPEDTVFVDIAAGDSCSFALTTEGAIYGWGTFRKNEGILGFERGSHTARFPVYIEGVTKVTQIACGTNHVLALDKDRHVYAWGNGQQNQLGRRVTERTLTESLQPNRVGFHDSSFKRPSQRIAQIACGDYHGLAIAEDGHIWAWGANNYCETGYAENAGADDASVLAPRIIQSLEGKNIETISGGSHHNIAITKDGQVLVWGRCDGSQTGIPASQLDAQEDGEKVLKNNGKPKILIEPTPIPSLKNIVAGSCGPEHTIVVDKDGKAYSWGFSANYQTGQGTDDDIDEPTAIDNTAVRETKLVWAGCGGQYSIVASKKE
ncbi:RCC1/BLIP-II [Dothidotthia symphoricarpi CBS 119687]|uniref:RCC1/BLIP-II n=1 Tax=Dothidotthia symphoricarpi CBS 119687 TaxID=1392245 RepID=A0A6A6ARU1_9PLEO|nr:RCC1/BLIP-II [Dothidotthia symphoricarpi CBS 119687]KAF2133241.1 RCC1/BLIP-II [Dothidotthia symphoricarpi CBS 119687]